MKRETKFINLLLPLILLLALLEHTSCKERYKVDSAVLISRSSLQDSLFRSLQTLTDTSLGEKSDDSLAFLILPVQASCPACRKKTIDSIIKYKETLPDNHFIIISASGGKKLIRSYFVEENSDLPQIPGKIFLDTVNKAYSFSLYDEKPTMYYSFNKKVYKKVASVPATVKRDLHEFFSGNRHQLISEIIVK